MKEVHIIFSRSEVGAFTGTIEELPEIMLTSSTLQEAQSHMFKILHLIYGEQVKERKFRLNITLKLNGNCAK